jgi:cobalamin biosynthesis Mg chelatase CobN
MSGAGHVQDMNNRLRQNRAQRPSKRAKFKDHNRDNIYSSSEGTYQALKFKTVPKEKLAEIKKQIKHRAKKEQKKEWIVITVLVVLVLIAAISIIWWS